tara:strand:- start:8639 stop:9214 length:576 start_codon:yes stop_codon:yes gene_type:complete
MPHFKVKGQDFFFLHIPKTGGKMLEQVFSQFGLRSGHDVLDSKPDAFSFAIIRNPLDRLVSSFFYLKAGGCCGMDADDALKYDIKNNDFGPWVKMLHADSENYFKQQHLRPMTKQIGNISFIDHYILFENLEEETKEIHKAFTGHEIDNLPIVNASKHDHYETYYTEETQKLASEVYSDDTLLYKSIKGKA